MTNHHTVQPNIYDFYLLYILSSFVSSYSWGWAEEKRKEKKAAAINLSFIPSSSAVNQYSSIVYSSPEYFWIISFSSMSAIIAIIGSLIISVKKLLHFQFVEICVMLESSIYNSLRGACILLCLCPDSYTGNLRGGGEGLSGSRGAVVRWAAPATHEPKLQSLNCFHSLKSVWLKEDIL